jgi:hypothetical protein
MALNEVRLPLDTRAKLAVEVSLADRKRVERIDNSGGLISPVEPGPRQEAHAPAIHAAVHPVAISFQMCTHSPLSGAVSVNAVSSAEPKSGSAPASVRRMARPTFARLETLSRHTQLRPLHPMERLAGERFEFPQEVQSGEFPPESSPALSRRPLRLVERQLSGNGTSIRTAGRGASSRAARSGRKRNVGFGDGDPGNLPFAHPGSGGSIGSASRARATQRYEPALRNP